MSPGVIKSIKPFYDTLNATNLAGVAATLRFVGFVCDVVVVIFCKFLSRIAIEAIVCTHQHVCPLSFKGLTTNV